MAMLRMPGGRFSCLAGPRPGGPGGVVCIRGSLYVGVPGIHLPTYYVLCSRPRCIVGTYYVQRMNASDMESECVCVGHIQHK